MPDTLLRYRVLCECGFCFVAGEFHEKPKPGAGHWCRDCRKKVLVSVERA